MTSPSSTDLLNGRIALVTGASRGIGRAAAIAMAEAGAHIIACARKKAPLEDLDDAIYTSTGRHATLIPFDITTPDAFDHVAAAVAERFGRLDVVVHAAAILGTLMPVSHHDPKEFDKVVAANITPLHRLLRAFEPLLRRSEAGRFIYLTTGPSAVAGRAFWGPYGASKAFGEALVRAWADEVAITSLRAVILDPGAIRTQMRAQAFPGENPETLPPPDAMAPLFVELANAAIEPPSEPLRFREWQARRAPQTA